MIFHRTADIMETVYLSLGSNLNDRKSILLWAISQLSEKAGTILAQSRWYETEAWGFKTQNKFINLCLACETNKSPKHFLSVCQRIESDAGRQRTGNSYTDRSLDIDIVFFGNRIICDEILKIPHPHFSARKFVLLPMHDIAPDYIDPQSGQSIKKLLAVCSDTSIVILK